MNPHILVLAAGKGKRMKSALPKVLHPVLGKPILHHIIETLQKIPHRSINIVVGHEEGLVRESCAKYPGVKFFFQKQPLGTADAVKSASEAFAKESGDILVVNGDVLLLRPETLTMFCESHRQHQASCTVATAEIPNPKGYGRIIRSGEKITAIREDADCSEAERKIQEINSGLYCYRCEDLFTALKLVTNQNKQKEFYLTDVSQILSKENKPVYRYLVPDASEILGINDRKELTEVESVLQKRVIDHWRREGVTIQDSATTYIDVDSQFGKDVTVEPGCRILGSRIQDGAYLESQSRIVSSVIGNSATVKQGCYVESSEIGAEASIGPYAHLRPGTVLGAKVKIGNFVEIKKATFAEGSKASHLAYIGDATIGKNVNLGCGFITCNYDGKAKHQTIIEDDVFVGSDSQVVAPVKIGKGSYVASGSTVTESVPADSLVISRGKQTTKAGYAKKYR